MSNPAPGFKETEEEVRRQLDHWAGLSYEEVTDLAVHGELNHDVFWYPPMQKALRTFIWEAERKTGQVLSIDEYGHVLQAGKFALASRLGLIRLTETLSANSLEREFEANADPKAIAAVLLAALGDLPDIPTILKNLVTEDALAVAFQEKRVQILHTKIDLDTKTYTELRIQTAGTNGRFLLVGGRKGRVQIKLTVMRYEPIDRSGRPLDEAIP